MKTNESVFMQMYNRTRNNEGSFNVSLFDCFLKADARNRFHLICAFPDFFSLSDYIYFSGELSPENLEKYNTIISIF